MPSFPTAKIEVLFSLCLAKAQVTRDRRGFGKLSGLLGELDIENAPQVTQKYLDESVNKKLLKNGIDEIPFIRLSAAYIEVLAVYAGYTDFDAFSQSWTVITQALEGQRFSSVKFCFEKVDEREIKSFLRETQYPDQTPQLKFIHSPEIDRGNTLRLASEAKGVLAILFCDAKWLGRLGEEERQTLMQSSSYVIVADETTVKGLRIFSRQEVKLLIQRLARIGGAFEGYDIDSSNIEQDEPITEPNDPCEPDEPDYGNDHVAEDDKPFGGTNIVVWVGVLALLLTVAFYYTWPCPSMLQSNIMGATVGLGITAELFALSAFVKPGFNRAIQVVAFLIVFGVLYFWNPLASYSIQQCSAELMLTGEVWLGQSRLPGAFVNAPKLSEQDVTNDQGAFYLPFDRQLLSEEIEVVVNYKGLTRQVTVAELAPDTRLKIVLSDTVQSLTDSLAYRLIEQKLQQRWQQIERKANELIRLNSGQRLSLKALKQYLDVWGKLSGGVSTDIQFDSEGVVRLETQKSIVELGLLKAPISFDSDWNMGSPEVYLLNWQYELLEGQTQNQILLEFLLLDSLEYPVDVLGEPKMYSRTSARYRIKQDHPISLAHVALEYSAATGWKKISKIRLMGEPPIAEYNFIFLHSVWSVANISLPKANPNL